MHPTGEAQHLVRVALEIVVANVQTRQGHIVRRRKSIVDALPDGHLELTFEPKART